MGTYSRGKTILVCFGISQLMSQPLVRNLSHPSYCGTWSLILKGMKNLMDEGSDSVPDWSIGFVQGITYQQSADPD